MSSRNWRSRSCDNSSNLSFVDFAHSFNDSSDLFTYVWNSRRKMSHGFHIPILIKLTNFRHYSSLGITLMPMATAWQGVHWPIISAYINRRMQRSWFHGRIWDKSEWGTKRYYGPLPQFQDLGGPEHDLEACTGRRGGPWPPAPPLPRYAHAWLHWCLWRKKNWLALNLIGKQVKNVTLISSIIWLRSRGRIGNDNVLWRTRCFDIVSPASTCWATTSSYPAIASDSSSWAISIESWWWSGRLLEGKIHFRLTERYVQEIVAAIHSLSFSCFSLAYHGLGKRLVN